jgi:hypothetical protein
MAVRFKKGQPEWVALFASMALWVHALSAMKLPNGWGTGLSCLGVVGRNFVEWVLKL